MLPHLSPHHPSTAAPVYSGRPVPGLTPAERFPAEASDPAQADVPMKGMPCPELFGVLGRATGSETAARPSSDPRDARSERVNAVAQNSVSRRWLPCSEANGRSYPRSSRSAASALPGLAPRVPVSGTVHGSHTDGRISNHGAPRGQKGRPALGAARTVTSVARAACQEYHEEVMRTIATVRLDQFRQQRLRSLWTVANARLAIADGRMHAIRLLSGDVSDVRNIEATCAKAAVSPVIFDIDPDPLSAA